MLRNLFPGVRTVLLSSLVMMAACSDQPKNGTVINGESIPRLLPADTVLGKPEERLTIRTTYNAAIEALKKNSDDPGPYLKLAEAYLMQSRISGNSAYYQAAVLKVLNRLIGAESSTGDQRFLANMYKSNVLFGMNRFKEALDAANEGLKLGDGNAGIWGAATDANVELGNYTEARRAANRMMELRPDLRSYARASYLRELSGDVPGAFDAMASAVESGVPGLEGTEWARVQLGDLCLNAGKIDSARTLYTAALEFRPGYSPASAGLAHLALLRRDYRTAVTQMNAAAAGMQDPLYLAELAQVQQLAGQGEQSAASVRRALELLKSEEAQIPEGMEPKPNYSREYAIIYRAARNYPKMLEYAKADQQLRPGNIEANALLAWALYLNGDATSAVPRMAQALASGWRQPRLLQQAMVIYQAAGDGAKANDLRSELARIGVPSDPVLDAETH